MLHRRCSRVRARTSSPPRPVSPVLARWLRAPGSLTARLREHGRVSVQVHRQGTGRLWPQERHVLGAVAGHVREITLRIDGVAVVWARSVTPCRSLKGPWKALKGLGNRPLAELLFAPQARVRRGRLACTHWPGHGPEQVGARRHWPADTRGAAVPVWARHSTFVHHGQRLQVMEALSPALSHLRTP